MSTLFQVRPFGRIWVARSLAHHYRLNIRLWLFRQNTRRIRLKYAIRRKGWFKAPTDGWFLFGAIVVYVVLSVAMAAGLLSWFGVTQ